MSTAKGVKNDEGKIRLGLVIKGFARGLLEVGRVGTFGANKYTDDGWQSVKDGQQRYLDALYRHLATWHCGEQNDEESGLCHLAHAAWNALAILTLSLGTKTEQCPMARDGEHTARDREHYAQ